MESLLASTGPESTPLLGEISLSVAPQAPFVSSRNLVSVHCPTPSASFESVNVITIQFGSVTQWMDPLTHQISMKVINTGAQDLVFASAHPMSCFQRMEILVGGQVCEDVCGANRLSHLLHVYESTDKRLTAAELGFGTKKTLNVAADKASPQLYRSTEHETVPIPAGQSKRVCFSINCSALLNQFKWIPLFALNGGVTIKLTLEDGKECTVRKRGTTALSTSYRLEDISLHASLCTLQSELQEKFFQSLAAGESLILHTQSWSHSQLFLAPGADSSYNSSLNKPLSRIDTIIASHAPEITDADKDTGQHYCNWLYGGQGFGVEDFQYQFMIGSTKFPQAPVTGFSQTYYMNLEALGIKNSGSHSCGVDMESFKTNHFTEIYQSASGCAKGTPTLSGRFVGYHI